MASSKGKRPKESSPDTERRPKKSKFLDDSSDEDDYLEARGSLSKMSKDQRTDKGLRSPCFSSIPSSHNRPAELFRKDLISAMKLADTEQLAQDDYVFISDPWRQEWERGVQVPVNPDIVTVSKGEARTMAEKSKITGDFKLSRKLLHAAQDETFKQGMHDLTGMQQLAEQVVRYDLDDIDVCWLKRTNEEREEMGNILIDEWVMEKAIEELEYECHDAMQKTIKTQQGLGIEYDADVICDVCRSPDSEDTNEMVFCDGCDICVHQACYGIQKIPQGSWLCRICAIGIKPLCILCPRLGGAMKPTKSGTKWSHVACALWIPEVSIGCVERMEPITKISQIPASRWSLICCLCKERTGACIQCSVKTCKTAFHVTCAFDNNLDMRTVLDESDEEDGVKLKAYCPRHSKKKDRTDSESDSLTKSPSKSPSKSPPHSPRKELTSEEQANLRADRLKRLEAEFYTLINVKSITSSLGFERSAVDMIYNYWKLKRKTNFDKPLLAPKHAEQELLEKQQEDSLVARMKMFVRLRQDLERVRNLCYMVSRREKIKRQYNRLKEGVFRGQVAVLTDEGINLTSRECSRIGNLYSRDTPPKDLSLLLGVTSPSVDDPYYRQRLSGSSKGGKGKMASTSKLDRTELHYKEMSAVLGGKDPRFTNNQDRQSRELSVSGKDSRPMTSEDSNADINKHRRTGGKLDNKHSNDLVNARTISRKGKLKTDDLWAMSQEDDISVTDTKDSLSVNVSNNNNNSSVEKAARLNRSQLLIGKALRASSTPRESRESSPQSVLSSKSSDIDYTPVSRPDKHLPTQAKRSKLSLGRSGAKARSRGKSINQTHLGESSIIVPVIGECDNSDLVDVEQLDEIPPDVISDVIDDVTVNVEVPVIVPENRNSMCNKKATPINGKHRHKRTSVTVKDTNGLQEEEDEDELSDLESDAAFKKVSRRLDQSYKKAGISVEKISVDRSDVHSADLEKRCEMLTCNVIIEEDLRHQAEERIKRDLGITDVSQLVIKDKIRDKIQHQFLNSSRAKRYMNGIHNKSQRRLDTYYKLVDRNNKRNATSLLSQLEPSRTSIQKTPVMNTVLNDISPRTNSVIKVALDSNELKISKKLSAFIPINDSEAVILEEKLYETRSRNGDSYSSSRSSTPDPLSARNRVGERKLSTSIVTRSRESTPDPSLRFPNGDMIDVDDLPGSLTRKQGQENIEDVLSSETQAKCFPIR